MQTILISRKFWAALISLLLVITAAFLPGLPDLAAPLTDLAVLTAAYICGTAIEGNPSASFTTTLYGLLRSRKFWGALSGLVLILLRSSIPDFPLADEQVSAIILTLSAYIFGTGVQDGLSSPKQSHAA
jgi:hypothetical protein